jgi:hypothetical protein
LSKDITTAGPSRRQIAKGAAWAVPAVTVAAAAPALAASPTLPNCTPADLEVSVVDCSLVGLLQPQTYFTVKNPADSGCVVPSGTQLSLTTQGIAAIGVNVLESLNVSADVIFSEAGQPSIARDLQPGESIDVHVLAADVQIDALARFTLGVVGGTSAAFTQTANVTAVGIDVLSICTVV